MNNIEKNRLNITDEENKLLYSVREPIKNLDIIMVENLIDKLIKFKKYEELIHLLNTIYDFSSVRIDVVSKLINNNSKECIGYLLNNENELYFLTNEEKNKLKTYINVKEGIFKLNQNYDYYYKLLFKQGCRLYSTINSINSKEYIFTRYNQDFRIKLKEIETDLYVSYIDYSLFDKTSEEQINIEKNYINQYGFNIK